MKNKIQDFYGVDMVLVSTKYSKGNFKTNTTRKNVFSLDFKSYNNTSKKGMVSPTTDCHFIINNYSVKKDSIFELNSISKLDFTFLSYGFIEYTTYCLPSNYKKVKDIQIELIKENVNSYKEYLKNELNNLTTFKI
tara:strand:+ start:52 stop:459 length:408 start_codon:yes stop_codon:yes gene_type:complete